jgi:hypothetical protein
MSAQQRLTPNHSSRILCYQLLLVDTQDIANRPLLSRSNLLVCNAGHPMEIETHIAHALLLLIKHSNHMLQPAPELVAVLWSIAAVPKIEFRVLAGRIALQRPICTRRMLVRPVAYCGYEWMPF